MAPKAEGSEYSVIRWLNDLLPVCVLTLTVYWVQGIVLNAVGKFPYMRLNFLENETVNTLLGKRVYFTNITIGEVSSFHDCDVQLPSGSHEQPKAGFCACCNKAAVGPCLQCADFEKGCILLPSPS